MCIQTFIFKEFPFPLVNLNKRHREKKQKCKYPAYLQFLSLYDKISPLNLETSEATL